MGCRTVQRLAAGDGNGCVAVVAATWRDVGSRLCVIRSDFALRRLVDACGFHLM